MGTLKVFHPYWSYGGKWVEPKTECWVLLAASIEPPTVQFLGFRRGRYNLVKKEADRLAQGKSTLVLGTHQSTAAMGKLVGDWVRRLGIPEQYHESFVKALGVVLARAYGHSTGGDDAVSQPLPDLVPGTPESAADANEGQSGSGDIEAPSPAESQS